MVCGEFIIKIQYIHRKNDNIYKKAKKSIYEFNKFFSTALKKNIILYKKYFLGRDNADKVEKTRITIQNKRKNIHLLKNGKHWYKKYSVESLKTFNLYSYCAQNRVFSLGLLSFIETKLKPT